MRDDATRRRLAATAAVITIAALTACAPSGSQSNTPGSTGGTADSSASLPAPPAPTPTLTAIPEDDFGETDEPTSLASPVTDPGAQTSALDLATRAMTAFARPAVPFEQWWSDLSPLLSETARAAYAGTDPANVPAHAVTGKAALLPSASGYLATAQIPTDVGDYTVLLSRPGQSAPWAVESLTPPAGLH